MQSKTVHFKVDLQGWIPTQYDAIQLSTLFKGIGWNPTLGEQSPVASPCFSPLCKEGWETWLVTRAESSSKSLAFIQLY